MVKVSIIVPVYNMEKYLKECLNSLFNQTLNEIEVVCINDGSTDHSLEILNEYGEKYANMIIYTQEKAGSGNARNSGIRLSKGEYVMFVDPDDYLAAYDALETLYETAKKNDVLVCGGCIIRNRNGILEKGVNEVLKKGGVEREGMFQFQECQIAANGHQRYILKRDFLLGNHIFYPEYRRGQDTLFIAKVLQASKKFYLTKKNVYVYRVEYKTEDYTEQKADDYMNALYDVLQMAIEHHLKDLYDYRLRTIHSVAKEVWYKLLIENKKWDKIIRFNRLIMRGNATFGYIENANCLMDEETYVNYVDELKERWENLEKIIMRYDQIAIYGAGMVGKRVCNYLRNKGYMPNCFVVTDTKGNEETVNGIPVVSIEKLSYEGDYLFILCALDSAIREDMKKQLKNRKKDHVIEFYYDIVNCFESMNE